MQYRDECMPLVSSVDTVYTTYYTLYDLHVVQLNNRNEFPPFFLCRKVIPCFLVHPPPCYKSDKKRVCNRAHQCVFSYSYLYYLHEYKLCRCARTTTPSRRGTQPLVMLLCGVFWRSNRNHNLVLVMRALAMSIHVGTYLPKFNNEMHYYYDIIPTAVPWGFYLQ